MQVVDDKQARETLRLKKPLPSKLDNKYPQVKTAHIKSRSLAYRITKVRRISIQSILQGANEITIEHSGQDYSLRITKNGKLILTK